jgi:hypothetical protein
MYLLNNMSNSKVESLSLDSVQGVQDDSIRPEAIDSDAKQISKKAKYAVAAFIIAVFVVGMCVGAGITAYVLLRPQAPASPPANTLKGGTYS